MDSLLESIKASGRGCYWNTHFTGTLCNADDLIILALPPDAVRKMTAECEESHGLRFNATKLICFGDQCPLRKLVSGSVGSLYRSLTPLFTSATV